MIRDVVLHLLNEQPLLIDVFDPPTPSDTALVGSATASAGSDASALKTASVLCGDTRLA